MLLLHIQNAHHLSRNTWTQNTSVLKIEKKEKYSCSIAKQHLYCYYKDLIPFISHMIGNRPCMYIVLWLMSRITHVENEASVRKMKGSDYQETKYMAIAASSSTQSFVCWSYLLSTSWLYLDKRHLPMLEDTNWFPTGLGLGKNA